MHYYSFKKSVLNFIVQNSFGCFIFSFLVQKITAYYNNIFPSLEFNYSSLSLSLTHSENIIYYDSEMEP